LLEGTLVSVEEASCFFLPPKHGWTFHSEEMMRYPDFDCLRVLAENGVATVTIDNPPINLVDSKFTRDLLKFIAMVKSDEDTKAIVFQSADPDFFLAHYNMAPGGDPAPPSPDPTLGPLQAAYVALSELPQATIVKLEGRARGAGCEFVWACDLRFAARGRAILGQPEVGVGLLPGAGGTQRLPLIAGRARALEVILLGEDFDADRAESYGLINRAVDPSDLDAVVADVARRVANFPAAAIRAAKESINRSASPVKDDLIAESRSFQERLSDPECHRRLRSFLERGGQTRAHIELALGSALDSLAK
jgi:enoyl-CoA hydratase/carnithine racemase